MTQPLTVPPGQKIRLADFDPRYCGEWTKAQAEPEIEKHVSALSELTYRLYAEDRRSLLIVLQGIDTAGKDGTIRTVMRGVNPQVCRVTSFKQPSAEELDHDFLWRIHKAVPGRGEVGIFNRSHYEDVIVVRVHELVPEKIWKRRYDVINVFEEMLVESGTTILKFFLHISREEQKERLMARLADPTKRWKFSKNDLLERKRWDEYDRAFDDALTYCNTEAAPWHIVPADRKWYRNLAISRTIHEALAKIDPQFPPAEEGLEEVLID